MMDNCFFCFGVWVGFTQADEALIGVNPDPKPLNRPGVHRNALRQVDSLDAYNFHTLLAIFYHTSYPKGSKWKPL